MNMHTIDWAIVIGLLAVLMGMAILGKKYVRSVADFLVAGRCAGRYIICISYGIAGIGVLDMVSLFEVIYDVGFTYQWWGFLLHPVLAICALTGWVLYRFRQTRAMTLAEFFEMRYNKGVRVFAGMLAFVAGIALMGIVPAVGARFFIYICGIPTDILWGIEGSTLVLVMLFLLGIALFFTFVGGQIVVMITDFIQGIAFYAVMIVIFFVVFATVFDWSQIAEALAMAPKDASMVNALQISGNKHFDVWFYMIDFFGIIYAYNAWQGGGAYHCSAKTPHEAKMGRVLGQIRTSVGWMVLFMFLPLCAYTYLRHPDFAQQAAAVKAILSGIENPQIQIQMTTPVAVAHFLPIGLLGCFAAVMLAAFISTCDTLLHSWSTIFIQDIVSPLRRKPLTPDQHMKWLRYAIVGVTVFIFFFSLLFSQKQYIIMFGLIFSSIFTSGVGAVIIGGLYWRRGTTSGAVASLVTGGVLSVAGIVILQIKPDFFLDAARCRFIAMASSLVMYIVVSLLSGRLTRQPLFLLDRMLHRGAYAVAEDSATVTREGKSIWKKLGMGKEFTLGDKVIFLSVYVWLFGWLTVFLVGTSVHLASGIETAVWLEFWHIFLFATMGMSVLILIWFLIGGIRDLKSLFHDLSVRKRDDTDDGTVINEDGTKLDGP
jgi:SSS family solute:Na+ symporter